MTDNTDTTDEPTGHDRRTFLRLAAAGIGGLAGCSSLLGGDETETTTTTTTSNAPPLSEGAPPVNTAWPSDQALPHFPPADSLDVTDVRDRSAPVRLLYVTLQGVVNRQQTRLYVDAASSVEGAGAWVSAFDVPTTSLDPDEVLEKYASELGGLVVYDPAVPDTINVATTLAGIAGAAVASPSIASRLTDEYDLDVVRDLRGRFSDGIDAYRWLSDTHASDLSDRMLVGLPPADGRILVTESTADYEVVLEADGTVRDGSNRKTRTIDLSSFLDGEKVYLRFEDAKPNARGSADLWHLKLSAGDWSAEFSPGGDIEDLFLYDPDGSSAEKTGAMSGRRWASGDEFFVYQFDPPAGANTLVAEADVGNQFRISATTEQPIAPEDRPPAPFVLFRDYAVANRAPVVWLDVTTASERELFESFLTDLETNSPYLGWFPKDVAGEFSGVDICAEHSVYVAPADYFENMSAFSGVRTPVDPAVAPTPETPALENKVYVTIVMSDGDNLQYDQHRLRVLWEDSARGEVPINWSISPLLLDAAPTILQYYLRTATENDLLMCGPSGAGYTYPAPWPDDTFGQYTAQTGRYLEQMGIDTMYLLNRESSRDVPLSDEAAAAYARDVDPAGIFLPHGESTVERRDAGFPQAVGPYTSSVGAFVDAVHENTPDDWTGDRPAFIAVAPITWDMNTSDVVTAVNRLDERYEIVRADHFFDLHGRAHES